MLDSVPVSQIEKYYHVAYLSTRQTTSQTSTYSTPFLHLSHHRYQLAFYINPTLLSFSVSITTTAMMMMIPKVQIPVLLDGGEEDCIDDDWRGSASIIDAYSCDEFRMYEFKIRRCVRGRSHDWTECPYAHPGEKARRRDPRKYHYSGVSCPDFRKGSCSRGEGCEFAHGVFECWLHPSRYRTQPCKDGVRCRRKVCFFAHTPDQLRIIPTPIGTVDSYDGSPMRRKQSQSKGVVLSPTSTLAGFGGRSTSLSPTGSESCGSPPVSPTVEELMLEMRKMGIRRSPHSSVPMITGDWMRQMAALNSSTTTTSNTICKPDLYDNVDEPEWFSDLMN